MSKKDYCPQLVQELAFLQERQFLGHFSQVADFSSRNSPSLQFLTHLAVPSSAFSTFTDSTSQDKHLVEEVHSLHKLEHLTQVPLLESKKCPDLHLVQVFTSEHSSHISLLEQT